MVAAAPRTSSTSSCSRRPPSISCSPRRMARAVSTAVSRSRSIARSPPEAAALWHCSRAAPSQCSQPSRTWPPGTACRAKCRSNGSWGAASAVATAALCRCGPPRAARTSSGRASKAPCSTPPRSCGSDDGPDYAHWFTHAGEPFHCGQRVLRLRSGIRPGRGYFPPRSRGGEGLVPDRAQRAPAAAHRGDARRHAQCHRAPGHRRAPVRARAAAAAARTARCRDRQRVRRHARRVRRGVAHPLRRRRRQRDRAEHLVPDIKEGGIQFGCSLHGTFDVVSAVRTVTRLPLIPKLTPNVTSVAAFARAAEDAGADAVSLVNTFLAMAIDVETRRPVLSNVMGGLSGPAIRPIAVRMVYECREHVRIPIIGMGGITDARDALEFIIAGASAVQVGTANFVDLFIWSKLLDGIADYGARHQIERLADLVGAAHAQAVED